MGVGGKSEVAVHGYAISFRGNENVLNLTVVMVAQSCAGHGAKTFLCVYLFYR